MHGRKTSRLPPANYSAAYKKAASASGTETLAAVRRTSEDLPSDVFLQLFWRSDWPDHQGG